MEGPTVRSEDSRTVDIRRAQASLNRMAQSLNKLHAAVHDSAERFMEAQACLANAAGGVTTVPAGTGLANKLGILMANDIIAGRPQDVMMELAMASELWDNPEGTDDPELLAGFIHTLREYVERGNRD